MKAPIPMDPASEEADDPNDPFDRADRIEDLLAEGQTARALELATSLAQDLLTLDADDFEAADPDDEVEIEEYLADLADFLAEVATEHLPALETDALLASFRFWPTMQKYERLEALSAAADWPARREWLLDLAADHELAEEAIGVLLMAGDIDRAIAALAQSMYMDYYHEKVVEAAVESRPDWAIMNCYAYAEWQIGYRRAQAYDRAMYWLSLARAAHAVRGTLADFWNDLDQIRRHYSKHPGLMWRLKRFSAGWGGVEGTPDPPPSQADVTTPPNQSDSRAARPPKTPDRS